MQSAPAIANSTVWRFSRAHWDFLRLLVKRDLKSRYAGSTLGAAWNLIHPIAMIAIYITLFSTLVTNRFGEDSRPLDYAAHLCSGLLVWLVFSESLARCTSALTDNAAFLKKIWFPPVLLHAAAVFNVLFVYSAGFVVLAVLLLAVGHPVPPTALATLPLMAAAGASALGIGLALSGLHVFFRDVGQTLTIALQLGFWFNPIVYPKSLLETSPLGDLTGLMSLNPTEHFVSLAQQSFGDPVAAPTPYALSVVVAFPVVCLLVGRALFRRMVPDVRDGL